MELAKASKRELLHELKHATESLRRLSRLIALLPDPHGRRSSQSRARAGNAGVLRTLGIGDLRAKAEPPAPPQVRQGASKVELARTEIARILADRLHPYFHRHDPEHHQAVERMRGLFSAAYGND